MPVIGICTPGELATFSFKITGCLGPLTYRTDQHGRQICYYEARLGEPLTPAQRLAQLKFNACQELWRSLTTQQRADYTRAANVTTSRMIGNHLFIWLWYRQDQHTVDQISNHYDIDLHLPPIGAFTP